MKDKPYSAFKKTKPLQLVLFDFMEAGTDDKHTNSIALYDLMPKYVWNARSVKRTPSIDGKFQSLPRLERDFVCGGMEYTVVVTPARLKINGVEIDYYPGEIEQNTEMGLRRLAIRKQRTHLIEGFAGLTFSLHELRKELKESGHEYSLAQIKQALEIMQRCNIDLYSKDKSMKISSPILPVSAVKQKQPDGSDVTFAVFHPLVSDGIKNLEFRQLDYVIFASFDNYVARWLHMRMVHYYRQASVSTPYSIKASTIVRDCGMQYDRIRDAFRKIRLALDELKDKGIVMFLTITQEAGERKNSVTDELYTITPSVKFSTEQKRANAIASQLLKRKEGADAVQLEQPRRR